MQEIKLFTFPADSPPLSVIFALSLSSPPVTSDPSASSSSAATSPTFVFSDGRKLSGRSVLLRYVGRSPNSLPSFYGRNAFESSQVDEWIDYAPVFSSGSSEFENGCTRVDKYLESANFLVGHSLSIADIAIWSALIESGPRWESLRKSSTKYRNLVRWFKKILLDYAEPLNKVVTFTTDVVAAAPRSKDQKRALKVDGKVFAPEPSGYRYMGAKAAVLNNSFAGAVYKYFAERYHTFQRIWKALAGRNT